MAGCETGFQPTHSQQQPTNANHTATHTANNSQQMLTTQLHTQPTTANHQFPIANHNIKAVSQLQLCHCPALHSQLILAGLQLFDGLIGQGL